MERLALNELQKKHSPLISALIVGVLWGFWHVPLWLTTGLTGEILIQYVVFFMIGIISISIIMTLFYRLNKNLFVPILVHQLFNFFTSKIQGELLGVLSYTSISYFIVAISVVVINPKDLLYENHKNRFFKKSKIEN